MFKHELLLLSYCNVCKNMNPLIGDNVKDKVPENISVYRHELFSRTDLRNDNNQTSKIDNTVLWTTNNEGGGIEEKNGCPS